MQVITEHVCRTPRHTTAYLAAGPADGPLLLFLHGWPELAISWEAQLQAFAALGFRAVAPDMRGYGRSSVPAEPTAYALEHIVHDMRELLAHLGRTQAVWVGHDWGAPVVWSLASHHPELCVAVAGLCVPHLPAGFVPDVLVELVDRTRYPVADYPAGQWDYQYFYETDAAKAALAFDADPARTLRALMRGGRPAVFDRPYPTARIRQDGGWFGGAEEAPEVPLDTGVLSEAALCAYASALGRNGFAGPDAWYRNAAANQAYAARAHDDGRLSLPVLFLHAAYDGVCDTTRSTLAEPMRAACPQLTEAVVASGHWMAQEQPVAVNAHLARWLATAVPAYWPGG